MKISRVRSPWTRRLLPAAAALALGGALLWQFLAHAPTAAPALPFTYLDGRNVALQSLRGRPVLVNFWATTCAVCRRELPGLSALYEELAPRGLEVIAVAMPYDPPNRVLAVVEREHVPFPVALDIEGRAVQAFGGVRATPMRFLVDPRGNIVLRRQGPMDPGELKEHIMPLLPPALPAG